MKKMKTTKKQIIKDMPVKGLKSKKQKERLERSHHDELIELADEWRDDELTEAEEDEILAQWEQECLERKEWLAANKLNDDSMEICD